ncbi:thioredoxin-dependent thiol peroxidase [uncultured Megasphaera sp.]|uniref:thioredoxin-dependent thiol peroxidase n=1 Tax=uncultured Megasphaera sp. TaxID=165188 RepID=UPI00265ACC12|nr:thioredoxin-dependent thiol peroxidase [uncultured Megasphaera sp.]
MLEIGMVAPDFSLPDQDGKTVALHDFKGKKVVLYFYPKDDTAGCTKQACGFAELYPQFQEKDAVVIGISKDSVASHKKFQEKYNLPFTLLSDEDKAIIQQYDVWKEKSMYGRKYMGIERSTYLIDENGVIARAFGKVRPGDNPKKMLKELPQA